MAKRPQTTTADIFTRHVEFAVYFPNLGEKYLHITSATINPLKWFCLDVIGFCLFVLILTIFIIILALKV